MTRETSQMDTWRGEFGKDYTDRNPHTSKEVDELYLKNFGVTRSSLNREFIGNIERNARILEVGCNVGSQLLLLQDMGFNSLYGIELQAYAVEEAKKRTRNINIIEGSAFDIPFKNDFFDLVFTSGVLIHISPDDISGAIAEIYRCTSSYIWGFEYCADSYEQVNYRGNDSLMWKTDFAAVYRDNFPSLELIKEQRIPYVGNDNVDTMFLMKKTGRRENG